MKMKFIALMGLMLGLSGAYADESFMLCSDPLDVDCVDPKWGQIDPNTITDDAMAATSARKASAKRHMLAAELMPVVADSSTSSLKREVAPKAVIDGTNKFEKQTEALTTAIKSVQFNARGQIVKGQRDLSAAAAAARKAAAGSGYALILYVKIPEKLRADQLRMLNRRLASVNLLLAPSKRVEKPRS